MLQRSGNETEDGKVQLRLSLLVAIERRGGEVILHGGVKCNYLIDKHVRHIILEMEHLMIRAFYLLLLLDERS